MGMEDGEGRQADRRLANELAAIHAIAFVGLARPWSAPEILALLTDPRMAVHVAHAEHKMPGSGRHAVGFALCRAVADEAELLTLAVMPETRREGLGVGLLTACEEGARASGAPGCSWKSRPPTLPPGRYTPARAIANAGGARITTCCPAAAATMRW